ISVELSRTGIEWVAFSGGPAFQLDGFALFGTAAVRPGIRLADQQIDSPGADSVLAVDVAAAVDDTVQERHHHQLRGHFVVAVPRREEFAVFLPERGERGE